MASHLIFIDRDNLVGLATAEQLEAVGLADHAHGARTVQCDGPEGLGGTLFGWDVSATGRMHFKAEEQTWIPAAKSGDLPARRYWVGVWNDSPPTEKDLRRPGTLWGEDIVLGDGKPWVVPVPAALPHDIMLATDGSLVMEPKRRYQDVCLEARRLRRLRLSADTVRIDYIVLWRFCLQCLNLNYRLPPELASHFRLIDTDNIRDVVLHCTPEENI